MVASDRKTKFNTVIQTLQAFFQESRNGHSATDFSCEMLEFSVPGKRSPGGIRGFAVPLILTINSSEQISCPPVVLSK
jgi:hypothetical protein